MSDKRYGVVLADPPWRFTEADGPFVAAVAFERHYQTMTPEEIAALPVGDLASPDCALFLWTIWVRMPQALTIIERWGFTFKTVAFVWVKQTRLRNGLHTGCGYWTRANTEVCLLATRGTPKRVARDVHQVILAPVREHSRKPDEQYARIERLMGDVPRIELFARRTSPGWDTWGNETDRFPAALTFQPTLGAAS